MKSSTRLNQPVWVIVVAIVAVALVGWWAIRASHTYGAKGQMAMQAAMQQRMQAMMSTLDKALGQLTVALQHADLAGKAADLAGLQVHVHHALNVMEGKQGSDYNAAAGDPGDGHGVQVYLEQLMKDMSHSPIFMNLMQQMGMSMAMRDQMVQALQSAEKAGQEAVEYLNDALKAKALDAAQSALKEAVDALKEMQGTPGSTDPKAGALTFAKTLMAQMMSMLPPGGK